MGGHAVRFHGVDRATIDFDFHVFLEELLGGPLHGVPLGSPKHLALVEAVRRLYRAAAVAADRADKESRRPKPTRPG